MAKKYKKQKFMQKRSIKPWQYIKLKAAILMQNLRLRFSNDTSLKQRSSLSIKGEVYTSIIDLPLTRYIDLAVDGNVTALIKSGYPEPGELMRAAESIGLQYADSVQGGEYIAYSRVSKQLLLEQLFLKQVTILIDALRRVYHSEMAEKLNKMMRTQYKFDVANPEQYEKELKSASNRSKATLINIELLTLQVNSMKTRFESNGEKVSRDYFYKWVYSFENHWKFRITIDSLTVFEFCERIRMMNEEIERANQAAKQISDGK